MLSIGFYMKKIYEKNLFCVVFYYVFSIKGTCVFVV